MKKNLNAINLFLFLILISCSCKKPDPTPVGMNSELISKRWKLTDLTVSGVSSFITMPNCSKDDLFIYTKAGNYTHDEGATKCDPSDPQIVETATWSLQQNLLKYNYPDGSSESYVISQLTTT